MELTQEQKAEISKLAIAAVNLESSMNAFANACVHNTDNQNKALATFFCVVIPMCMAYIDAVKKACEDAEAAKTEGGAE